MSNNCSKAFISLIWSQFLLVKRMRERAHFTLKPLVTFGDRTTTHGIWRLQNGGQMRVRATLIGFHAHFFSLIHSDPIKRNKHNIGNKATYIPPWNFHKLYWACIRSSANHYATRPECMLCVASYTRVGNRANVLLS